MFAYRLDARDDPAALAEQVARLPGRVGGDGAGHVLRGGVDRVVGEEGHALLLIPNRLNYRKKIVRHRWTQMNTDKCKFLSYLCSSVSICGDNSYAFPSRPASRFSRLRGSPLCREFHFA